MRLQSQIVTALEAKMKQNYDKNTKERCFKSGDKLLAFLPVPGTHIKLDTLVRNCTDEGQ